MTTTAETALDADLLAYLRQITALRAGRLPPDRRYGSYEALVLDLGRPWTPAALPPVARRGPMKACYENAWRLVQRAQRGKLPPLTYCEGYAVPMIDGWAGIAVTHAWAIDEAGNVWDPTWPEPERSAYHGIAFEWADVCRYVLKTEWFGILDGEYRLGAPLLKTGRLFGPTDEGESNDGS